MAAEWRDIPGWEGLYQASSDGQIRNVGSGGRRVPGALRTLRPGKSGYLYVTLHRLHGSRTYTVHSLVALAFHGPRPSGHEVDHIDTDILNNAAGNLQYLTKPAHWRKTTDAGSHRGERNGRARLTESQVREILSLVGTMRVAAIARRFGHLDATVRAITSGRTWRHVQAQTRTE